MLVYVFFANGAVIFATGLLGLVVPELAAASVPLTIIVGFMIGRQLGKNVTSIFNENRWFLAVVSLFARYSLIAAICWLALDQFELQSSALASAKAFYAENANLVHAVASAVFLFELIATRFGIYLGYRAKMSGRAEPVILKASSTAANNVPPQPIGNVTPSAGIGMRDLRKARGG